MPSHCCRPGAYNFSPTELAQVDTALGNINPELPALLTNGGILTDPNYLTYLTDPSSRGHHRLDRSPRSVIRRLQLPGSRQRPPDVVPRRRHKPVDPTLFDGPQHCGHRLLLPGRPGGARGCSASARPRRRRGATDPTALSTDLSTLLASLGTTAGSDVLSQLVSELGTQFAADFGTVLPSSI